MAMPMSYNSDITSIFGGSKRMEEISQRNLLKKANNNSVNKRISPIFLEDYAPPVIGTWDLQFSLHGAP